MTPRKIEEDETIMTNEALPRFKTIQRFISKTNVSVPEGNYWKIEEVDAYVSSWMDQGYKILNVAYIGERPEGYGVMFFLEKI